jgi:hypothetical protein
MAQYFSTADGNLGDIKSFGLSLSSAETMNYTTGTKLLTSSVNSVGINFNTNYNINALALNVSSADINPSGNLEIDIETYKLNTSIIDSSSGNLSIVPTSNPYQVMNTPYHPNGWSGYFNGINSYIRVPHNNNFQLLSGNFTIDFWLNTKSTNTIILNKGADTTTNLGTISISINTNGTLLFYCYPVKSATTNSFLLSTNTTTPVNNNVWNHIAITRNADIWRCYINGVLNVSATNPIGFYEDTNPLFIGVRSLVSTTPRYLDGFISNLRIIKGQALYTDTTYTLPTSTYPFSSTVVSLSDKIDNVDTLLTCSSYTKEEEYKNPNALATSNFSPYLPYWSGYFNGLSSKVIATSGSNFSYGTGNFTFETWFYLTNYSANPTNTVLFSQTSSVNTLQNYFVVGIGPTGFPFFTYGNNSGTTIVGTSACDLNKWYHLALVREGTGANQTKMYINGVSTKTDTISFDFSNSVFNPTIGGYIYNNTSNLSGYISNLRIVKGQALYTGAFTPSNINLSLTSNGDATNNNVNPLSTNISLLTLQDNKFIDNSLSTKQLSTNNVFIKSFNPFNNNIPYDPNIYGGSINFDATNNIYLPYSKDLYDWWTMDYTLEYWIYLTGVVTSKDVSSGIGNVEFASTGNFWSFGPVSASPTSNVLKFYYYTGSTGYSNISSNAVIPINCWTHLAFTYKSSGPLSGATLYINGSAINSVPIKTLGTPNSNINTTYALTIGKYGTITVPNGTYMSNIRIVKGEVIIPPLGGPKTIQQQNTNTNLLLNFASNNQNKTILDSTTNNLIKAGTTTAQSSYTPYFPDIGSTIFNASTDFIETPLGLLTSDNFTIECWFYAFNTSADNALLVRGTGGSTASFLMTDNTSKKIKFTIGTTSGESSTTYKNDDWNHVVAIKSADKFYVYLNGIKGTEYTIAGYTSNITGIKIAGSTFRGYISNLRIVKNEILYSSNFKVPTSALTKTSNGGATPSTLPTSSNVVLLTLQDNRFKDNSNSNLNLNVSGVPSIENSNPFSQNYSPSIHDGSVYFDGTATCALTLSSDAFLMRTSPFTIECWAYKTKNVANQAIFTSTTIARASASTIGGGYNLYFDNSARLILGYNGYKNNAIGNDTLIIGTSADFPVNAWTHIGITRNATSLKGYINGIEKGSATINNTIPFNSDFQPAIGKNDNLTTLNWNGYISNFRIIKGESIIPTIPTQPLSTTKNTVFLMSNKNNTVYDSTGTTTIQLLGSGRLSQNTKAFDNSVLYFDGTNASWALLNLNPKEYINANKDFTIQFWVYPISVAGTQRILTSTTGGFNTTTFSFRIDTGKFVVYMASTATITSTIAPAVNNWYHILISRSSGTVYLYVNGVLEGQKASVTTVPDKLLYLGGHYNGSEGFNGYLSDFRFINGTALYNTNFNTPLNKLTNITYTLSTNSNVSLYTLHKPYIIDDSGYVSDLSSSNVRVEQNTPYLKKEYLKNIHGGAIEFNNSKLTCGSISNWKFLHNRNTNWTMDFWIYLKAYPTANTDFIYTCGTNAATQAGIVFILQTTGKITFNISDKSGNYVINPTTCIASNILKLNQWTHVAITYDSNYLSVYYNGILISKFFTSKVAASNIDNNLPLNIAGGLFGYISNFRVINGQTIYTNNFDINTITNILSATPQTVLLLNGINNGKVNSVSYTYPISSFTTYDGNNNTYSTNSRNWQLIPLVPAISGVTNDLLNIKLKTSNNNQLNLVGDSYIVDSVYNNTFSVVNVTHENEVFLGKSFKLLKFLDNPNISSEIIINGNYSNVLDKDFTIEMWTKNNYLSSQTPLFDNGYIRTIFSTNQAQIDTTGFQISLGTRSNQGLNAISSYNVSVNNSDSIIITGTIPICDGNLHHVAVTRDNNDMRLFVDGVQSGPTVRNTTIFDKGSAATTGWRLGKFISGNYARYQNGYILKFRAIKDRALYTTNFIASTIAHPDALSATIDTILLLDAGGVNYNKALITNNTPTLTAAITNTASVTVSAASPYNTGDTYIFTGANYLTVDSNDNFNFLLNDFTIECWFINRQNTTGARALISYFTGGATWTSNVGFLLDLVDSNKLTFRAGNNTPINIVSNTTIVNDRWYHAAVCRRSGITKLFLDGKLVGISNAVASITQASTTKINIGRANDGTELLNGAISNIRILKGVGLYNDNFTPPTLAEINNLKHNTTLLIRSPHNLGYYESTSHLGYTDVHIHHTLSAESYTLSSIHIHNKGVLTFPYNSSKTLTLTNNAGIQITSEGTMNIGTSSLPISSNFTQIISSSDPSIGIHVHNGGNLNIYGAYRVPYSHLSIDASAVTGRFIANQSLSSTWLSGDNLVLTNNVSGLSTIDGLILSGFENNNIFRTTTNSVYRHTSLNSNPYIPSVSNLTRNVSLNTFINDAGYSNININNASFNTNYLFGSENNNSSLYNLNNNVFNNCGNLLPTYHSSGYFNATKANITNGLATDGNIFTIEGWVNIPNFNPGKTLAFCGRNSNILPNQFKIQFTTAGKVEFYSGTTSSGAGSLAGTSSTALLPNIWYHIAVVRTVTSGTTNIYINGKLEITSSANGSYTQPLVIGGYSHDTSNSVLFIGYMSNFRVVIGQALYTGNFIPSTIPLTRTTNGNAIGNNVNPLSTNVKLLTFQNNGLIDNSSNNIIVTSTPNPIIFTKFSPFVSLKNNLNFYKNILFNSKTPLNFNDLKGSNINITDNMFIANSAFTTGLQLIGVSANNLTMSGNYVVGLTGIGTYIQDCSATGNIGGTINFNGTNGVVVSGNNYGNISNIVSVSSRNNGIVINQSNINTTYSNITSNNNNLNGILLSGNNLNYLTPTIINFLNNIQANNNKDAGIEAYNIVGNITGLTVNNNINNNIKISIGNGPTVFDGLTSIITNDSGIANKQNISMNILSAFNINYDTIIKNSYLSAKSVDAALSASVAINLNSTRFKNFEVRNSSLLGTNSIGLSAPRELVQGTYHFNNCKIGNLPVGSGLAGTYQPSNANTDGFVYTNFNQINGYHITYENSGQRLTDSTILFGDQNTEKLIPFSTTIKLHSGSKYVALNSSQKTLVSVYVRIDSTYNGTLPKLIVKANPSVGIMENTIIDTCDAVMDEFQILTGYSPITNDVGVLEFFVECDGTSGFINIGQWQAI